MPEPTADGPSVPAERKVVLPSGLRLALRVSEPRARSGRAFLLVHGLASNARLWDGVAGHLAAAGHQVVAVDQRGHGASPAPPDGYDTDTCADDLADLIGVLGWERPVVAGQSWGANVALSLAARHRCVSAVACVDGGWLRPAERFATFEECWAWLEPPHLEAMTYDEVAGRIARQHPDWPPGAVTATLANLVRLPGGGVRARLSREHHREIVRSLFEGDPRLWYPRIDVPVLLVPATPAGSGEGHTAADVGRAVEEARAGLRDARVRPYPGADHDLHAQHPGRLAADLLTLAASVNGGHGEPAGTGGAVSPDPMTASKETPWA